MRKWDGREGGTCHENHADKARQMLLSDFLSDSRRGAGAGRTCRVVKGFLWGRLKRGFPILRIFTDFRIARLPMS